MNVTPETIAHRFADQFPAPVAPAAAAPAPSPAVPPAPVPAPSDRLGPSGCHLDFTVTPEHVVAAAELLAAYGFAFDTITGVDWIKQDQMEVIYDYFHALTGWRAAVRTRVPRSAAELPTVMKVFPGADWHERETHDFFGIRFLGNPNLTPFLLPDDADYHPLKKDFQP